MALNVAKSTDALMRNLGPGEPIAVITGDLTADILAGGRERVGEVVLAFNGTAIGWCRKLLVGALSDTAPISRITSMMSASVETDDGASAPLLLVGFGDAKSAWGLVPAGGEEAMQRFVDAYFAHHPPGTDA